MNEPRKLSPALLAALGLSACTDGCNPEDLPFVGTLFDDGDDRGEGVDEDRVGPCLEVPPPLVPRPDVGPCLSPMPAPAVMPTQPITRPVRVGPCLKVRMPTPVPEPPVRPCLDFAAPPPPPPPPAPEDQSGLVLPERVEVLATLLEAGILPPDVLRRIDRGSG